MNWQIVLQLLGALSLPTMIVVLATLLPTIRKARAEARKADVDAAITEDAGDDAHYTSILDAQFRLLVQPMRDRLEDQERRLERLQARIESLEQQVTVHRTKYWRAIAFIRELLSLLAHHAPEAAVPTAPTEISPDI